MRGLIHRICLINLCPVSLSRNVPLAWAILRARCLEPRAVQLAFGLGLRSFPAWFRAGYQGDRISDNGERTVNTGPVPDAVGAEGQGGRASHAAGECLPSFSLRKGVLEPGDDLRRDRIHSIDALGEDACPG